MQARDYGGQIGNSLNNFHSVFQYDSLFDLAEFPPLTNARRNKSLTKSNDLQLPGSKPRAEQSEFPMCSDVFSPLPGAEITDGASNYSLGKYDDADKDTGGAVSVDVKDFKQGAQMSPDGKVTNIPTNIINNQFGMVGLLAFIRAVESDPNLAILGLGQDLTGLGVNVHSKENLHPTFGGPFSDQPCRPQDVDVDVPPEYLVSMATQNKLPQLPNLILKKYKDDLLFFLFYGNVGDYLQLEAAAALFSRDWRYHIEEKVWIKRLPDSHSESNGKAERGTFDYFDARKWRRVPKDFDIDPSKLEKCPNLSAIVGVSGQPM